MKAVYRMIAAGLLLALLAGCGAGQGSYEWAVEPQLQADKIEPLAVSGGGMLEGSLPEGEALLALCAAQKGGLWGLVDGHTGEWVVEPRFSQRPTLCPDGHLLAAGLDGTLLSDPELDRQLRAGVAIGSGFDVEFVLSRRAEPHFEAARARPRAAARLGGAGRGGGQVPSVFRGD